MRGNGLSKCCGSEPMLRMYPNHTDPISGPQVAYVCRTCAIRGRFAPINGNGHEAAFHASVSWEHGSRRLCEIQKARLTPAAVTQSPALGIE